MARMAALAAALLLATACTSPLGALTRNGRPASSPGAGASAAATPSPVAVSPNAPEAAPKDLAGADAAFYRGDYDAAGQAYASFAQQQVPGAAGHYALYLTYQNRFTEGLKAAQDAVAQKEDSSSLARLTRALDWSESVPQAVAAGLRATQAGPVDPLAWIYYGEALADAGLYDDAQKALTRAESMKRDAYATAETDREWANYFRAKGDVQQELNHLQLSLKAQPQFPERQLELIRYEYSAQKGDQAKARAGAVRMQHANDFSVLTSLGLTALFSGDAASAGTFYDAALALRPDSPDAVLGRAEIAVVASRDFGGARAMLVSALKKNPDSGPVYQYLRHLDTLVLKTDATADLQPASPAAVQAIDLERQQALARVNEFRGMQGLTPVAADANVAAGAEAHAFYYLFNLGQPSLSGLGIHGEDSGLPGFTGANSLERSRHFGYPGTRGSEIINHVFSPAAAVQVWQDSVYHRFPIMSRETLVAGYGEASLGVISIHVIDFGLSAAGSSDPVVYPVPDQKGVPPAFVGHEVPDPAPAGVAYPVGYPITLQVGARDVLSNVTGKLLDSSGAEVQSVSLKPGDKVDANEWSIFSVQPLRPGADYTVDMQGTLDGRPYSKRWTFRTAPTS